jgi:hypothetical protein
VKPNDENLIWEAYQPEAEETELFPIELDDERGELDDEDHEYEEGDLVALTKAVGGGEGKIIELSPAGTHAIIELIKGQTETDLEKGDRVSAHVSDLLMLPETLEDEDDVPYGESSSKKPKKPGPGEFDIKNTEPGTSGSVPAPWTRSSFAPGTEHDKANKAKKPKARLPEKLKAIINKKLS